MKNILIILSILILQACNEKELQNFGVLKVEGVDRYGNNRVCYQNINEICEESANLAERQFAANCEANGNIPHQCSCNEYICEQKTYQGLDKNGKLKECTPMSLDVVCTMEFTDGDQFAMDCEDDGNTAIQCGCHDYICVDDNQAVAPVEELSNEESFGSNQEGIRRSCLPMSEDKVCPTVLNRAQIFAQNCRSEGYEVTWCSCDEVLCLDQ